MPLVSVKLVEEVKSGDWGIADIKALAAGSPVG
jgi:phenylpyruvate tautomerase PptA (4-oxalocrotonate tautomerase family)